MAQSIVSVRCAVAQFPAVERTLAGQCLLVRLRFASQYCQHWIVAELLVIVQVFIDQRQHLNPVSYYHLLHRVLDPICVAAVLHHRKSSFHR